jgi:hypothetical protein
VVSISCPKTQRSVHSWAMLANTGFHVWQQNKENIQLAAICRWSSLILHYRRVFLAQSIIKYIIIRPTIKLGSSPSSPCS